MSTAMDIPVFVNQDNLKAINISRLKERMVEHQFSIEEAEALESDLDDLRRLRDKGYLTSREFQVCWMRAFKKHQALTRAFGNALRTNQ